jgi:hypothetical protein
MVWDANRRNYSVLQQEAAGRKCCSTFTNCAELPFGHSSRLMSRESIVLAGQGGGVSALQILNLLASTLHPTCEPLDIKYKL